MGQNNDPYNEKPMEQGIIEWSVLDGLLALKKPGAPDPRRRVIAIYIDSAPKLMEAMMAACAASDPTSLKNAAHSLKSASMNVGAKGLGAICADLEQIAAADHLDDAERLIHMAETSFKAVIASLVEALQLM